MIKAKITVFDDETGQVFVKDRVIEPCREELNLGMLSHVDASGYYTTSYEFRFGFEKMDAVSKRIDPIKKCCLRCKHFSCNKPMPYCDNRVTEYCTLHPDEEDAYGYCDDYEGFM